MSSAIQQEYEEGLRVLGGRRMRYYKLMSMFSFENGNEVHFGEGLAAYCNDRQQYDQLKEYIKEQKKWIRMTDQHDDIELRMWWLQIKLVEFAIFSPSEQRSIFPLFKM